MSEWINRLVYPPLYVIFLLIAVYAIYRSFTIGFEKGEYVGKYTPHTEGGPVVVEEETFDLAELLKPTDELIDQGKELYNINCSSCHGPGGMGDGPKSMGLNPPPRKFPTEQFKQGAGTLQIYQTLNTGVPGSSMAAFSFMNPRELMSLAHYVRSFISDPPADPPELVQQLAPASSGGAASPVPSAGDSSMEDSTTADSMQQSATPAGKPLPVDFIIEQMLAGQQPRSMPLAHVSPAYAQFCAACHGAHGEGAVVPRKFTEAGTVYAHTRPLSSVPMRILASDSALAEFLAKGMPGQPGHRFTELTPEQISTLRKTLLQALEN